MYMGATWLVCRCEASCARQLQVARQQQQHQQQDVCAVCVQVSCMSVAQAQVCARVAAAVCELQL